MVCVNLEISSKMRLTTTNDISQVGLHTLVRHRSVSQGRDFSIKLV